LKINKMVQESDPVSRPAFSLDQPEKPSPTHPAVTWLMVYGAYLLAAKIIQLLLPLYIQNFGGGDAMRYYRTSNLIFGLGEVAVLVGIMVNVRHPLCRVLFGVFALASLVMVVGTQYAMRLH
jgi:hypothetical protein